MLCFSKVLTFVSLRDYRAYSILRNETKRNETKYMGEGEKMLINLNTA